jgi:hypothetical protein
MLQVARNLLDADDGFLAGKRFLVLDRDPLYTAAFCALLRSAGVTPIRLPPSSPNLNAYAERFVRSIKSECLAKLVLLGENHLRTAVREYVAHYHTERNHQGIEGRFIEPQANAAGAGPIDRCERMGGLLRFLPPAGGLSAAAAVRIDRRLRTPPSTQPLLSPAGGLKRVDRLFVHYAQHQGAKPAAANISLSFAAEIRKTCLGLCPTAAARSMRLAVVTA